MKANAVLKLLHITRPTLCSYVKKKILAVKTLPNGQYDYDESSVYKFLNKDIERKHVLYCRVSTQKQKKDLENQESTLKEFCNKTGIRISEIYKDIIHHKISKVYITYKDRLSRLSFDMFKNLFKEFHCEIIISQ
jgi:predicted site-specific integrase-resolvase